jgi:glyoxylase-like metal-dependent hydrolase (beta-lactamase superfamily II)
VAGRIRPLSEAASPVPDLLALSSAIIDGTSDEPASRVTLECSEVADGIAMVESFSNVVALDTDDGLVLFDTSLAPYATKVLRALRGWSSAPVHTVVYTHGHVDHVGGAGAVVAEALDAGRAAPTVIAHEAVTERFARYRLTRGYNGWINARQFGGTGLTGDDSGSGQAAPLFPANFVEPDRTYTTALEHTVGGWDLSMHHGRGETDDHTWTWLADRRAVAVGATPPTGLPPSAASSRCVPSCSSPPTACPSPERTGWRSCSVTWPAPSRRCSPGRSTP